ncbi:MAG: hypothetical protein ACRD16_10805 [Thermoanaerobaculia bacterium]
MTSVFLLLLFAASCAAIQTAAIGLGRPLSRGALAAAVGLPLLFLLPGFFSATTPLPTDHSLGYWPWHVESEGPARNANLNDLATQMAPWAKAVRLAYKNKELPLRDRWNGCGTPLAANGQSAAFSPFTFLGLLLPLARAATLTGALKLALALSGMWLWLRELRISDLAALFGAISFSFSMTMIPWLFFPHTAVICLWPWALFAIERLRDRSGSFRAFILLATIFAVWPLCGHIESVALGCAFIALWLAGRAALGGLPEFRGLALRIGAAGALALALSAFSLVPQALAIRASNRFVLAARPSWSADFSFWPRAKFWHGGLLTPFFPRVFGDEIAAPMIAGGAGSFPEMALGAFGLVGWVLALSVFRPGSRRNRAQWALLVPMALGLGAAIDVWPFAELSGAIPLFRMVPALRFLSFLSIGGSAVAAFEADRVSRDLREGRKTWIFPAALAIGLAGAASFAFLRLRPFHVATGGWRSERRAWIFYAAVLSAAAAAFVLFGFRRRLASFAPAAFALLAAGSLFWDGQRIYRYHSLSKLFPETPLVRFLKTRPKPFRVLGEGVTLFPNTNVFAGVEDVRTHDPVERREYVEFLDRNCGYDPSPYFKMLRDVNAPALDFLNVRYLVSTPGRAAPGAKWGLVYAGADGTVFENADVWPRIFSEDPSRAVEISGYAETTNRVTFHSKASGDRALPTTASFVQDGGWTALDESGVALPVTRVRGLFLGLAVPPGEHDIVLAYSPPGFRTGCGISLGALAGAAAAAGVFFSRRARGGVPARAG